MHNDYTNIAIKYTLDYYKNNRDSVVLHELMHADVITWTLDDHNRIKDYKFHVENSRFGEWKDAYGSGAAKLSARVQELFDPDNYAIKSLETFIPTYPDSCLQQQQRAWLDQLYTLPALPLLPPQPAIIPPPPGPHTAALNIILCLTLVMTDGDAAHAPPDGYDGPDSVNDIALPAETFGGLVRDQECEDESDGLGGCRERGDKERADLDGVVVCGDLETEMRTVSHRAVVVCEW
ncbi:hypothetical protein EJ04DRAFT_566856 [Polyplosphaeria fusca]|uniref:Uncharacterized protein n=1 Tax=Polyplosphaeria fusca TaxID=682080 RepID=A0A9P4QUT6_9PLEO|nr:hypothetical protein EJ04DRAFT_566856 [Polyplosphaeria fusca]